MFTHVGKQICHIQIDKMFHDDQYPIDIFQHAQTHTYVRMSDLTDSCTHLYIKVFENIYFSSYVIRN